MQRLIQAFQFLTILPVPFLRARVTTEVPLGTAAPFFPVVGGILAAVSYLFFGIVSSALPWRVSVLTLVFTPLILSGGLHMDGLSDFCDGFFSARASRDEVLRIMKDSRIGVMGTLGVFFVLLSKYELLVSLAGRGSIFFFMLIASRAVQVVLAYFSTYVGTASGMGKAFVGQIARRDLILAVFISIGFCLPMGIYFTLAEVIALAFFVWILSWYVKKRIGGVTGDVLGAASELSEVCILAVAAWILPS